jgi:deoxyribodipyrimidine photo-lyase
MAQHHHTVLHWFRKDLRVTDNTALLEATAQSQQVIPVYVLSEWKGTHHWTGPKRQHFLCGCLRSLAGNLKSLGSRLILRSGDAVAALEQLVQETGASAIFFNRDYDPFGVATEQRLITRCSELGVSVISAKDRVLHEAAEVVTGSGGEYRVYTPYSRNWLSQPKPGVQGKPQSLGAPPAEELPSLPLPELDYWGLTLDTTEPLPEAGERAARERMKDFVGSTILTGYAQKRNLPAGLTTSRLGADLRFGLISIRELYQHCMTAAQQVQGDALVSIQTYIKELAWREFYLAILHRHPEVFDDAFNQEWRGLPWPGREDHYQAWCTGRTGFPIVDAGIRELRATGFMHNRVRMIVSMFLTKDLHCDWRLGESFFMQHLLDGENASNNGGWQWSAGTGADAAPYFRIQNPWTQTKSYDPDGVYIKKWIPELAAVPGPLLQAAPPPGRSLAPGYPAPIVDHATERERTLALFKQHRQGA